MEEFLDKYLNVDTYLRIISSLWEGDVLYKIFSVLLIPIFCSLYLVLLIPYVLFQLTQVVNKHVKNLLLRIIIIYFIWGFPILIFIKYVSKINDDYRVNQVISDSTSTDVEENNTNQATPTPTCDTITETNTNSEPPPVVESIPSVSYDHNLGNSAVAAEYAQKLLDATEAVGSGFIKSIFVEVSPENADRGTVSSVFIQVKIDSTLWDSTSEGTQKDFVSSWLTSSKKEFPKAFPHVYISNSFRQVAKGELSIMGEPKIELK